MIQSILNNVQEEFPHLEYGRDYVHLGFQEGREFVMRQWPFL